MLRDLAIVEIVRKLRGFLWMNCHAKHMECDQLAGAVEGCHAPESRSKLRALQTLRAVQLRQCLLAAMRYPGVLPLSSRARFLVAEIGRASCRERV